MKKPDDVCVDAADRGAKIACRMLDDSTLLIEADAEGLTFLGQLILAQAGYAPDCGFSIHPNAAGSALFAPDSKVGIYLHRLPCLDKQVGSGHQSLDAEDG